MAGARILSAECALGMKTETSRRHQKRAQKSLAVRVAEEHGSVMRE